MYLWVFHNLLYFFHASYCHYCSRFEEELCAVVISSGSFITSPWCGMTTWLGVGVAQGGRRMLVIFLHVS